MTIMGLPSGLHWLAWFIKQFSFLMISVVLMVILFKVSLLILYQLNSYFLVLISVIIGSVQTRTRRSPMLRVIRLLIVSTVNRLYVFLGPSRWSRGHKRFLLVL